MEEIVVEVERPKISGDYAWVVMAVSIFIYDVLSIKSQRAETMSSAIWKSLSHPVRSPVAFLSWSVLTYHLFGSKNARDSYKKLVIYKK